MPKYIVRHGRMRTLSVLNVRDNDVSYARGDQVVARTRRGLEVGEVLCDATKEAIAHLE